MVSIDLDTDFDIDGDGVADFSWSDIISFKGLIHFGIGFCWTMWFNRGLENQFLAAIIALVVGLVFVIVLWFVYRITKKLESVIPTEEGETLAGREVEIYYNSGNGSYQAYVTKEGSKKLIRVLSRSGKIYLPGEKTIIIRSVGNSIYYIN
jgi:amino acid permease